MTDAEFTLELVAKVAHLESIAKGAIANTDRAIKMLEAEKAISAKLLDALKVYSGGAS